MMRAQSWIQTGLPIDDWEGVHESLEASWLDQASRFGTLILGVLVALLVLRAILRRGRYRAVDVLSEADQAAIENEVAALEAKTKGEIVLVVVERSDAHPGAHAHAALAMLGVGSVLAAGNLPWNHPSAVLVAQFAMAALGYGLSRLLPDVQRLFVGEKRATDVAEEQALQEFQRLELQSTAERTGLIIMVSLLERRVVVLADEGLHQKVDASAWTAVDDAVLAEVSKGSLCAGLLAGARVAGSLLAEHFPSDGGGDDELPNSVTIRRK